MEFSIVDQSCSLPTSSNCEKFKVFISRNKASRCSKTSWSWVMGQNGGIAADRIEVQTTELQALLSYLPGSGVQGYLCNHYLFFLKLRRIVFILRKRKICMENLQCSFNFRNCVPNYLKAIILIQSTQFTELYSA